MKGRVLDALCLFLLVSNETNKKYDIISKIKKEINA